LSEANYFRVQRNQNDKSQRASEYSKFQFAAWTNRRLIGQLISAGHNNHLRSELSFLSMHPGRRPGVQAGAFFASELTSPD
jgi:hypothetical protein